MPKDSVLSLRCRLRPTKGLAEVDGRVEFLRVSRVTALGIDVCTWWSLVGSWFRSGFVSRKESRPQWQGDEFR